MWIKRQIDGKSIVRDVKGEELRDLISDSFTQKGKAKSELVCFHAAPTLKTIPGKEASFGWTFSTDDVDRYLDVVEQSGWLLDNFQLNPVILWSHNHSIPAIGVAENISVAKSLQGIVTFDDSDDFAVKILGKVRKGIIKAGSVGFLPLELEYVDDPKSPEFFRYTKQELIEFSICNVPANPFALIQQSADDSRIKELEKKIKELEDKQENAPLGKYFRRNA